MLKGLSEYQLLELIRKIMNNNAVIDENLTSTEEEILKLFKKLDLITIDSTNKLVKTQNFIKCETLAVIYKIRESSGWRYWELSCITPKYNTNIGGDIVLKVENCTNEEKLEKRKKELESFKRQQSRELSKIIKNVKDNRDYNIEAKMRLPITGSICLVFTGRFLYYLLSNCKRFYNSIKKLECKKYSYPGKMIDDRHKLFFLFPVTERQILENDELYEEIIYKKNYYLIEFPTVANVILFGKDSGGPINFIKNVKSAKKITVITDSGRESIIAANRFKETFKDVNIEIEHTDNLFKELDRIHDSALFIISNTIPACFEKILSFDIHRKYQGNYLLIPRDILQNTGYEILIDMINSCKDFEIFSDEDSHVSECIIRIINEYIINEIKFWRERFTELGFGSE